MNISTNNNINPQFKAIRVATTQNIVNKKLTNIDLYKIQQNDEKFLLKLKKKISIKKSFPNLSPEAIKDWQHIVNYCLNRALDTSLTTYIGISDNKPCCIMNYCEDIEGLYLCGVCSLPIAVGQKVCNAGKTMFLQLFKDALNNDFECINLITGFKDYFNVVKKYRNLGFKIKKTNLHVNAMEIKEPTIGKKVQELSKKIKYTSCREEFVNLEKITS